MDEAVEVEDEAGIQRGATKSRLTAGCWTSPSTPGEPFLLSEFLTWFEAQGATDAQIHLACLFVSTIFMHRSRRYADRRHGRAGRPPDRRPAVRHRISRSSCSIPTRRTIPVTQIDLNDVNLNDAGECRAFGRTLADLLLFSLRSRPLDRQYRELMRTYDECMALRMVFDGLLEGLGAEVIERHPNLGLVVGVTSSDSPLLVEHPARQPGRGRAPGHGGRAGDPAGALLSRRRPGGSRRWRPGR